MENLFFFLTELSSQSRRPGLPPGFPEHGSASRVSDTTATASGSDLAASRDLALTAHLLRGVWYQTTNNEYRPIEQIVSAVVKDHGFYIGRDDHGILRPIFSQQREMIIVDAETGRPYQLYPEQAAILGMNLPLRENLISARIAARRRNRGRNN